jgi:hypothetical protein
MERIEMEDDFPELLEKLEKYQEKSFRLIIEPEEIEEFGKLVKHTLY